MADDSSQTAVEGIDPGQFAGPRVEIPQSGAHPIESAEAGGILPPPEPTMMTDLFCPPKWTSFIMNYKGKDEEIWEYQVDSVHCFECGHSFYRSAWFIKNGKTIITYADIIGLTYVRVRRYICRVCKKSKIQYLPDMYYHVGADHKITKRLGYLILSMVGKDNSRIFSRVADVLSLPERTISSIWYNRFSTDNDNNSPVTSQLLKVIRTRWEG